MAEKIRTLACAESFYEDLKQRAKALRDLQKGISGLSLGIDAKAMLYDEIGLGAGTIETVIYGLELADKERIENAKALITRYVVSRDEVEQRQVQGHIKILADEYGIQTNTSPDGKVSFESADEQIARMDAAFAKLEKIEESYRRHFGPIRPITER